LPVAGNRVSLKQVMNRETRIVSWFLCWAATYIAA
jgi:hypothetical protein